MLQPFPHQDVGPTPQNHLHAQCLCSVEFYNIYTARHHFLPLFTGVVLEGLCRGYTIYRGTFEIKSNILLITRACIIYFYLD